MGVFGSVIGWAKRKFGHDEEERNREMVEHALNSGLDGLNKIYSRYHWFGPRGNNTIFFTITDELQDLEPDFSLVWDDEDKTKATLSYTTGDGGNMSATMVCSPDDCKVERVEALTNSKYTQEFVHAIDEHMKKQGANLNEDIVKIQKKRAAEL